MAQQPTFQQWPGAGAPPGWRGEGWPRTPSGLFPSGPRRPTYREPHPVRGAAAAAGVGVTAAWLLFFGLLGGNLSGYAWWTAAAGGVAWLIALVLTRRGDRGVAVGIALVAALAWSIAAVVVAAQWAVSGNWPLW